jgi:hypothetical protein
MLEKNGKVMVAKHGGRRQGDVRCMYDNKRNRIMLAGEATIGKLSLVCNMNQDLLLTWKQSRGVR